MSAPASHLAPVREAVRLCDGIFSLRIATRELAQSVEPGQFLGVRVGPGEEPLLRRPISVADVVKDELRLVFRVVGQGTELLSRVRRGDVLDVLGPLGRPAPGLAALKGKRHSATGKLVVCGGGVGIAPLLFFTRRLGRRSAVRVFLGARTREQLILAREFARLGVGVKTATDDGSAGYCGTVAELAARESVGQDTTAVVACGPRPMLRELLRRFDPVPVWGFIEERMGCGTGICYCCALPRKGGGYVRFCREGPVVLLNEVEL